MDWLPQEQNNLDGTGESMLEPQSPNLTTPATKNDSFVMMG